MTKQLHTNNNNAVIYARYSSHAQRDVSIEQQINVCKPFAAQNGLTVVDVYADHAMTGTNDSRPAFQKMIKDATTRAFGYVIVYQFERFARDRYASIIYKKALKDCGVKVLSVQENITSDPSGVIMEALYEAMAEYYSKDLSRKVRRGMNYNASQCMTNGPVPYGYMRGKNGKYEIVKDEAIIVQEIYERFINGESVTSIRNDLNARHIRNKLGNEWRHTSFNKLLRNKKYYGLYEYGEYCVENGVPAIISKELFDKVQIEIDNRKENKPMRKRNYDNAYLLTGKIYCGKCQSAMTGMSGHNHAGGSYQYYSCHKRRMEKNL